MQVHFESRDVKNDAIRARVVRRVELAMRRLSRLLPQVKVRLSDLNGPRGGVDKQCQVQVQTHGRGAVVVSATASDWGRAVDDALRRAMRALLRTLQQPRERLRLPRRLPQSSGAR